MACIFIEREPESPGIIDEKVAQYYALRDKYGSFARLKEAGRGEIYSEVLEDDPAAIRAYDATELKLLKPPPELRTALADLKAKGLSINIVSDVSSGKGLEVIVKFLNLNDLRFFFDEIFTGLGCIRPDGSLDSSYKGLSKRTGTFYDKLAAELKGRGISPAQGVIIGDSHLADISQGKARGFRTICYTGFTGQGGSEADYEISHFRQLANLFG